MVNIEINGKTLQAPQGAMVIEVADQAGITIPRFCYHNKLSVAANCRMCLVEVEKVPKPLPACATPVSEGMKVFTRSPKAIAAQRAVLEFLLINHPLDCPICDQGGECDLQEMAMGYGNSASSYTLTKRVVSNKQLGPLISTDMTRCIHCTRCVRFGQEVAGIMELGATGRGEHTEIGTYVTRSVASELSGNVIDLCPVGALTSKPFRFSARSWEMSEHPGVAPHDCVGSNVTLQVRNGALMRVLPRDNEAVNEVWLADRDRFSYLALDHTERATAPMIKTADGWQATDWESALAFAAEGLQRVAQDNANQLGALASSSSTVEELYLLQKLMRALGSNNIDHRLRQLDFSAQFDVPPAPWLGRSIASLETVDAALLVGSNLRKEQPLLAQRLRKAVRSGAAVVAVGSSGFDQAFKLAARQVVAPQALVAELSAIAAALAELNPSAAPDGLNGAPDDTHRRIAQLLHDGKQVAVLFGSEAQGHSAQGDLLRLAAAISRMAAGRFGIVADGGNAVGAALAGCLPHRGPAGQACDPGKDWHALLRDGVRGLVLLGVEPELDCADSALAQKAVGEAEFVVSLTAYRSERIDDYANVILPIALYPETSGSYVNAEGLWQSAPGAVQPAGEARPGWKVLRVLGNLLDLTGFEYVSSEEVRDELNGACPSMPEALDVAWQAPAAAAAVNGLVRIGGATIHGVDMMVRRSPALQATPDAKAAQTVRVHPATLQAAGVSDVKSARLQQGETTITLPLVADDTVAEGCVYLAQGFDGSTGFGPCGSEITLEGVQ